MSTKTPDPRGGPDLEAMFAAARADAPEPPAGLLARIATDAEAELDRQHAMRERRGSALERLLGILRRHMGEAGGLVAAMLAGLWIGIASPADIAAPLGGDEAEASAALIDPVSAYDLAFLGD